MKTPVIIFTSLLLFSCTQKKQGTEAVKFDTPGDVVTSFVAAMNAQDSDAIKNVIVSHSKESILGTINSIGGFQKMFASMKGMQLKVDIIGVDSSSLMFTKVYTNQSIIKDSSVNMKMDSLYFATEKEDGGWKMKSLNAQPGKNYQITGEPAK